MAVEIGKYLRSKSCGDATVAVDAVREGLHTRSTMRKLRGRRGILAVDAVFSQTTTLIFQWRILLTEMNSNRQGNRR